MMDPVAMGMSACLCARLRDIAGDETLGSSRENLAVLPSAVELEHAIEDLICQQTKSGIWPKYFPMFHYHDAGSNFCFTFELLEAVLYEFGKKRWRLLDMPVFIDGLEKAVTWCERNRLRSTEGTVSYAGWNSGGHIITLGKEQPESWATAVVHMFLYELTRVVSQRIQHHVLRKYGGRDPKPKKDKSAATLDGLLDMEVLLPGGTERLTPLLKKRIVDPFKSEDEITLRRKSIKIPRSALLFGPPGTSKTEVTKAIADDLQWPYVEIGPSEFLKGSLANIYLQADEIFRDLMDLSGVIVFFDEMDALVQTREGEVGPDITSQFLTTTMLPKLAHLHDHARVVFFMATNYQDRFDAAIKRAGRFDLLLCMWPPLLKEKLSRLHRIYGLDEANPQTRKAGELIEKYTTGYQKVQDTLSLLTFGEYRSFLNTIGTGENIGDAIESLGDEPLRKRVEEQSAYSTLKLAELEPLQTTDMKFNAIAELDGPGLTRQKLKDRKVPISPTLRYFCDRKESKEQH
jgi:hypothetical protein